MPNKRPYADHGTGYHLYSVRVFLPRRRTGPGPARRRALMTRSIHDTAQARNGTAKRRARCPSRRYTRRGGAQPPQTRPGAWRSGPTRRWTQDRIRPPLCVIVRRPVPRWHRTAQPSALRSCRITGRCARRTRRPSGSRASGKSARPRPSAPPSGGPPPRPAAPRPSKAVPKPRQRCSARGCCVAVDRHRGRVNG